MKELKDILTRCIPDISSSNTFKSFLESNHLSPDLDKDLLVLAYRQLNKISGLCVRCLEPSKQCKYLDRQVKIVEGNIEIVSCDKEYINNLYPNLINHTFDNYCPQNRSQKEALSVCKLIANKFKEGQRYNLYLYSDVGLGKTHLVSALFSNLQCKKHFINFIHILNEFRSVFAARQSSDRLLNKLRKVPLLYIDDIGKSVIKDEYDRTWVKDIFYDCLNYRTEHNKMTLYTSNKNLEDLGNIIGKDVISRISQTTIVKHLVGNDYRQQQGKNLLDELQGE